MAQPFNLTAQLNLRGPSNIRNIVSDIRRQLGTITADINLRVDPNATRNLTQINTALQNLNGTFGTTQTAARNAAAAIRDFSQAVGGIGIRNVPRDLANAGAAAQRMGQNVRGAAQQLNTARTEMEEFGRQSALAIRRFAAFSVVTGIVFSFTNALKQGISAFIDFDKEFVKLQQVTDESAAGLQGLAKTITNLSSGLGVASSDLIQVSSTLAQAGLSARDTERALKALALSDLAPSFDGLNKTVEGSIALMRQFGISAGDLDKALGSINAVAAKFAVEAGDIIAAIQRTGGVFASASRGVSEGTEALNEFVSVFTSVRATTRESAETIATGLRTIFTRIQRGDTIEALKEFGVNLTDAEGKFVGAYKAVELLSRGLNQIDPRDLKFSQIVEELGGFRQIGKVIPLIQQFSTAQQALKVAQQGQGSLAEDAAKAQLSLANQISKVREEFLGLIRDIGGSDSFQTLAKGALDLASGLIKVADSVKGVLPALTALLAIRGTSAAFQFGTGFVGGLRRSGGARGLGNRLGGGAQGNAYGGVIRRYAVGGNVKDVDVALMPGEAVLYPEAVKKVGVSALRKMNYADKKMAKGGKVGIVPGSGNSDSFYTTLPEGSFVLRKDATKAIGMNNIADIASGRQKFRAGTTEPLQISHLGGKRPLKTFLGTSGIRLRGRPLDNYTVALPSRINQDLRVGVGRGVDPEDLISAISSMDPSILFGSQITGKNPSTGKGRGGYGTIRGIDRGSQNMLRSEFAKLAPDIKSSMIGALRKRVSSGQLKYPIFDSDLKFLRTTFISSMKKASPDLFKAIQRINEYDVSERDNPGLSDAKRRVILRGRKTARVRSAIGGLIQKFGDGSDSPLKDMGRAGLLKEAARLGVNVPRDIRTLLDPRARGSEQARAKLIKELEDQRIIQKTRQDKISSKAQKTKIGIVGLLGETGSEEVITPDVKGRKKRGEKTTKGFPATLQKGVLPPDISKKVRAIIRNRSERIIADIGRIISQAAGSQPVKDRKLIRSILSKQLPDLEGLMFESGLASAGAPYASKKQAIDFPKGLGPEISKLVGIDPGSLVDATRDTGTAGSKIIQATRYKRDIQQAKKKRRLGKAFGGLVGFAKGGLTLVDDLPNAPGSMLPIPGISKGSPLYNIIKNKGGALDFDRTLQRTTGDAAYASAKTPEQKEAVLDKYFRDPKARLEDVKSARLTQFGKQLQELVKKGVIKPQNLSIISKSAKVPGLAEHISKMFGIPIGNMEFTSGKSKGPILKEFSKARRIKRAGGGEIPILAQEGEYVINRNSARAIGYGNLAKLNKYHSGGKVQKLARGGPSRADVGATGPMIGFDFNDKILSSYANTFGQRLIAGADLLVGKGITGATSAIELVGKRFFGMSSAAGDIQHNLGILERALPGLSDAVIKNGAANKRSLIAQDKLVTNLIKQANNMGGPGTASGSSFLQNAMHRMQTDTASKTPQQPNPFASMGGSMGRAAGGTGGNPFATMGGSMGAMARGTPTSTTGGRPDTQARSGRMSNAAMGLGFAVPMIAEQFTVSDPKSAQQAGQNAMAGGIGSAVGGAAMLASMGPVGIAAGLVAGAGGIVKAFADAENATNEFNKQIKVDKLETELEKAAKGLDKFSKDVKNVDLAKESRSQILSINKQAADIAGTQNVKRGLINFNDTGEGAYQRSEILNREGIMGYLSSTQLFGGKDADKKQASLFSKAIPDLSKEAAKTFSSASDSTAKFLENTVRSGTSISDLKTKETSEDFIKLTSSLALADAAVQSQIMSIDNSNAANKQALKDNIIAVAAETKAREIQNRVIKEMAIEDLNRSTIVLQNSLERMFQNMEQAISSNAFAMDKLTASAELASSSLSGSAKVGSIKLDSINTLQNPRANNKQSNITAINQSSSMFGSEAPAMKAILQVASSAEDAILSTINTTLKKNPSATNESVGGSIDRAVFKSLADLKLPPDLSAKLSAEVGSAVKDMRKSGEDKVDFSQLVEKIPQLGKVIDSAKRAQEVAIKALENWQNALNEYANTTNQLIDLQVDSNQKLRRATDILVNGQNELNRVLGKSISLASVVSDSTNRTASQTGGPTDPVGIRRQIQGLEQIRASQQARSDTASQRGTAGKDEFVMMQERLKNTSVALRESYDALKNLAENSDVASAALGKMSEIQQKQQAGVSIIERLVTSTPKEIAQLNQAFARLGNNMQGRANFGTNADQRKQTLDAFNMIVPFLGDNQGGIKANVLESMMRESGLNMSPMLQQVVDSLRNPSADPQMAEAIRIYNEAVKLQSAANTELVKLNTQMANNSAEIAATKLAQSMSGVTLKFESQQLLDINTNIKNLVAIAQKGGAAPAGGAVPVAGIASGGIVYASAGQLVNFQPKGTDTVPAMLTPGEFVVNRAATQKNLPLLKSINNGYSKGGKVGYYAYGGLVFGDPWQRDDKASALDQSKVTTNESIESFPKLPKGSVDFTNYFEDVFTIPGSFYATNKQPGPVSDWFYKSDSSRPFKGLQMDTMSALGDGLTEITAKIGGGQLDASSPALLSVKKLKNVAPSPLGKAPTAAFFDDIISDSNLQKEKLSDDTTKIQQYTDTLKLIVRALPDVDASGGDILKINKSNVILDSIFNPKNRPKLNPQVQITKSGNDEIVQLRNLGQNNSNRYGLLTKRMMSLTKETAGQEGSLGNIIGIQQGISSLGYFSDDRYMRIVAGLGSMMNAAGGYDIGNMIADNYSNYERADLSEDMAGLKDRFARASRIKTMLLETQNALGNIKFTESNKSQESKQYIDKIQKLIDGSIFKAVFSENEINPNDDARPPVTLYNLSANDWDPRVDALALDNSIPKGSYAGKSGKDWIPVGSRTMGIGADPDRFSIAKYFPWTSAGFNSDIFNMLGQKYSQTNPNNVKVQEKTYSSNDMKFNYADIEGPMLDSSKRFMMNGGNPFKFSVVRLSEGMKKEPLNPFKDLIDLIDTNMYHIYANNINAAADMIRQSFDPINKTISGYSLIQKLPSSDEALKLDFSQITKDNAYFNKIIPGFAYKAPTYMDELQKKIKDEQLQARGQAGEQAEIGAMTIGLKSQLDTLKKDTSKNGSSYLTSAIDIIKNTVGSDMGVLSGYGMKLMPLRSANQIASYGSLLLQGQQYFQKAVNAKFGNRKVDDRLWGVWGRLGAAGQAMMKLGSKDIDGLSGMLSGGSGGDTIGKAVRSYGDLLAARSALSAGSQQALSAELDQGSKTSVEDILGRAMAEEATVGKNGKISMNRLDKRNAPSTLLDLGKKIINPYSTFMPRDRASLFDILIPKLEGKINPKAIDSLNTLKNFYLRYLDPLVNFGAGSVNPKNYEEEYEKSAPALQLLTSGEYGQMPRYNKALELAAAKELRAREAQGRAKGGVIYASTGTLVNYEPRGTDTVPAMLTPGEFVVNRQATQKNLPLLKSINSGQYAQGGRINYRNQGGIITPQYHSVTPTVTNRVGVSNIGSRISLEISRQSSSILDNFNKTFDENVRKLTYININLGENSRKAINDFTLGLQNVSNTLSQLKIPENIQITANHKVEVVLNGGQVLADMQEGVKQYVVRSINNAMYKLNIETDNSLGGGSSGYANYS